MKVLIVDDNAEERKLLVLYLRHRNWETLEAADGRAGLDMIFRHRPDLIISDALMPVMDGFQLLHEVKSRPEIGAIPFVFYSSAYTGGRDAEFAIAQGAAAFILKPKEPSEFWEELSAALARVPGEPAAQGGGATGEQDFLREYSTVVAAKLEEKYRELERANASLRESEQRQRTLFENSPAVMLVVDPDTGAIIDHNAAAGSFYGYSKEELGRLSVTELSTLGRDELPTLAQASRSPQHVERRHRLRSGEVRDVEIYRGPMTIGSRACVFSIIHDVTQRKSLESQLRQAQKMEAVGTLSGGIAHDFNNILTIIAGFVMLLKSRLGAGGDDTTLSYLDNILATATRAANMIKSLLVFSRNQPVEMKALDLHAAVTGMKKLLERLVREDIELVVGAAEAMPVMGDEGLIGQVLMNLTSNARAAMPQGGTISISFTQIAIDRDFIETHGYGHTGNHALLTFSDTGVGMEEETRRRIFEPFFTTKAVGEGTGLGLSTVYGIVKQHCGFINCISAPGQGTTFQIYFPLIRETPEEAALPTPEVPARGHETLLLAEDDTMLRGLFKEILEEGGYTVVEAADGEDAVARFREYAGEIALVVLDMVMPRKSGAEAAAEIRALSPDMKVLLLSGYQGATPGKESGMTLLSKPVAPADLLLKLRELLGG